MHTHTVYMELIPQNLTVYVVMWVHITWEEQPWKLNFCNYVYGFKKTGSRIYQYKINNNVKMLNGKINRSVGNTSSEDGLFKFTVVSHIEYEWVLFQGHTDCSIALLRFQCHSHGWQS